MRWWEQLETFQILSKEFQYFSSNYPFLGHFCSPECIIYSKNRQYVLWLTIVNIRYLVDIDMNALQSYAISESCMKIKWSDAKTMLNWVSGVIGMCS